MRIFLRKIQGTLNSVEECVESGVPCIAECGGFMYLHEIMEDSDKKRTQYGRHNQREVQKNRPFATLRIYGNDGKQR